VVADVRGTTGPPQAVERARVDRLRSFLAELAPTEVPAETALATSAAALIADDRGLCRVEDLAARTGVGIRSLQRLFAEHIGLSPKKVIRRYRLLEAAEAVSAGSAVSWAQLAVELGFTDQAHLTREFTAAFGVPPARYAGGSPTPEIGGSDRAWT
jgi:transcriptional regulator GlxA family with amidase domain